MVLARTVRLNPRLTAARTHGIVDALTAANIPRWADKAYRSAGSPIRVPCPGQAVQLLVRSAGGQPLPPVHPSPGKCAVSIVKTWRLLRSLRRSTTHIIDLAGAVLALHLNTG